MIIDSNVLYGADVESNTDLGIGRVMDIMDKKGIDKALITNIKCKFYDFKEGNDETAAVVKMYPDRFYGMASFNIAQFMDIEEEVKRAVFGLGLAGIRLFNIDENFTSGWGGGIDSLTVDMVLGLIDGYDIPVFIEAGYPFKTIKVIAQRYPRIPMIVSGVGCGNTGEAILAAKDAGNLFIEISTMDIMEGVGVLAGYLGADKVIFGTGLPYNSPSCELMMVNKAYMSEEDKQKIFSGNIQKILQKRGV